MGGEIGRASRGFIIVLVGSEDLSVRPPANRRSDADENQSVDCIDDRPKDFFRRSKRLADPQGRQAKESGHPEQDDEHDDPCCLSIQQGFGLFAGGRNRFLSFFCVYGFLRGRGIIWL